MVQVAYDLSASYQTVEITGRLGWATTIPESVYQAILSHAAANAVSLSGGGALVASSISQGPVKIGYSNSEEVVNGMSGQAGQLMKPYMSAVDRYKLYEVGGAV
jgi:hypothetical protein